MPDISAAEVKALRDRTGAGMMDCKKALIEAGGDTDKHDGKTIGELQAQIAATTGENVVIRRFSRFVVGE